MQNTTRLGPAPAPAAAPLSEARRRVLEAVVGVDPPARLASVAQILGGHPNTTRQHLDALTAWGLLENHTLPPAGRGRPAHGYAITQAGRRALAGDRTSVSYAHLVDALADHLAEQGLAADHALAIGRTWAAAGIPGRPDDPTRADLLDVLERLGFDPEHHPRQPGVIRLRSCPVLESANRHPEVICQIHRGLIEAVLDPDPQSGTTGFRLQPFAEPGACLIVPEGP